MKLSSVVNRINGNVDRFTTDLMYYIGGEHFESNELAITKKGLLKENLNILGFKFHFAFQERDVIFMARNPHLRKAGMVMFSGLCSDASYILRSKDENVLTQEFLAVQLQSDHFWDYCESHKVGSVNFANNWSSIANYEFDLPPIEVQRKIGEKVWAAYRVKESYKKLLAATDDMLKAKFQEMFGDIFENTRNWKEYGPFPKYTEILLGSTPKSSEPSFWNGDVLWITPAEMLDEIVVYSDTARHITKEGAKNAHLSILPKGTVLFSTRAPIGKVGIVGQEMYCNQGFKNFHCGEMLNEYFLYYSLLQKREYFQGLGTGSTFKELSKSTIEKICIAVPPLKLQCDFAKIFTQAEATKESLRKSIENIDQVIKSLINQ